jgi:hypothetical protein
MEDQPPGLARENELCRALAFGTSRLDRAPC